MLSGSTILLTGGTGSFGSAFVPMTIERYKPRRIIVFSRDEMKQWEMAKHYGHLPEVRFFIGDVRDRERLYRAMDGVDYVVHAAATKIVPTAAPVWVKSAWAACGYQACLATPKSSTTTREAPDASRATNRFWGLISR